MEMIRDTVRGIVERKLHEKVFLSKMHQNEEIDNQISELVTFVLLVCEDIRFYTYSSSSQVADLWETHIRPNETVVDFIMSTTTELKFDVGSDQWKTVVIPELIQALAGFRDSGKVNGRGGGEVLPGIDDDLLDRLPTFKDMEVLLGLNHWFATMLLISLAPPQYEKVFTEIYTKNQRLRS